LVEINDVSVRNWNFEKIIRVCRAIADDGVRIRSLGFELLHDDIGIDNRTFVWSVARRRLYSFNSFIRGYKHERGGDPVNDNDGNTNNEDGEEECKTNVCYEIHCELVVRHYQGYDETISFSVWKRFSEFKELHQGLKEKFEWQIDGLTQKGLKFPSNKVMQSIVYGQLSERFMDSRRHELQDYWSTLQTCSQLFDFGDPSSHRYSQDIALFLDVEKHLHSPDIPDSTATSISRNSNRHGKSHAEIEYIADCKISETEETSASAHPGLDLDISAISDVKMNTSTGLKLDESSSLIGEIIVPSTHGLSPMAPRSSRRTRNSAKKRRKKTAPAFQRKLLDEF